LTIDTGPDVHKLIYRCSTLCLGTGIGYNYTHWIMFLSHIPKSRVFGCTFCIPREVIIKFLLSAHQT